MSVVEYAVEDREAETGHVLVLTIPTKWQMFLAWVTRLRKKYASPNLAEVSYSFIVIRVFNYFH